MATGSTRTKAAIEIFNHAAGIPAHATRDIAAAAVHEALHGLSVVSIQALANAARARFVHRVLSGAWGEKPNLAYVEGIAPRERASVMRLFSLHRDGYVRELALREMETTMIVGQAGADIPYLVLRCDDIVPVLQTIAERALRAHLTANDALAFARVLPLLRTLGARLRGGQSSLLGEVRALLASDDPRVRDALDTAARDADVPTRLEAFRLLAQWDPVNAARSQLADADTRVRLAGVRAVLENTPLQLALLPLVEASGMPYARSR